MIERENYLAAHRALHALWTQHAGTPGYDKAAWLELDDAIFKLATDGPGPRTDIDEDRNHILSLIWMGDVEP